MRAISLGNSCTTRFQITRHAYCAHHPGATVEAFRASKWLKHGETHIFDWQVTPLPAVTAYISRDFDGIFEREDLVIDPSCDAVRNRRFDVIHSHAFNADGTMLTEAGVDAQYARSRSKIEYLAAKFRRLLDRECGPFLYVVCYAPAENEVGDLLAALQKRAPQQDFHIAFVARAYEPARDLSMFGPCVSQFRVAADSGKAHAFDWEGHDESWDMALRKIGSISAAPLSGLRRIWRKIGYHLPMPAIGS